MDAYDIFKKLTKGLKFKTNIIGTKAKTQLPNGSEPKLEKVIKQQPPEDDVEPEEVAESDVDGLSAAEDEQQSCEELQLINGVKVGKKKKKKADKPVNLKEKLEEEENNRFRNEHGIRVVGRAVPPALADFASACARYGLAESLADTVERCGYTEPTPVQRQAIPCMLENRQILACAPTGSGKTAAFLVPVVHALSAGGGCGGGGGGGGPRALVLCPTRELAKQTYREALRLTAGTSLRASVLNKITDVKIREREATFRKSDIVITTPNRLCYLLNQENLSLSLDRVRWLIVDEADKLFEGSAEQESDFRQQMERVLAACGGRERRVAMFSATHTPAVAKWCRRHLRGLINITVGQRNAATSLVRQELLYCGNEAGKLLAFRQLVQRGLKPPVLVFVQSKDRAKQLFKELIYDGINVDVIHADRTQAQRDNVVRSFRVGKIWVLICTELMGRGIDFRGVNLVVNYDFPPSAIAYIHRIGRAGRAGQTGHAITFFTQDDVSNLRRAAFAGIFLKMLTSCRAEPSREWTSSRTTQPIAAVMKQSGCEVPPYTLQLKQNANARRQLAKRAPRRDHIATAPDAARKRKLEEDKRKEESKTKGPVRNDGTDAVKNSKKAKQRKTDANSDKGSKKKDFAKRPKPKKKLGKGKHVVPNKDKGKKKKM